MKFLITALIFCGAVATLAQSPVVPHKMHFAGMTLTIREDARSEIQKDVDALTQSPKYFGIKVERARTYFPLIEKIFAEERVPDDFKFLCLQESALIADAVSVSDAVGFWQFKDFTAREVGLRVDDDVDERMNIVSSTRGAARYIKQNNFMFNNWLYALQAYQMGAGGVKRSVGDNHDGSRHMDVTSETYWYVKKFLAHKVAFEDAIKVSGQLKVTLYDVSNGSSLTQVAEKSSADLNKLREYNKWIKKDVIPADKSYSVILPEGEAVNDFNKLWVASAGKSTVVEAQKKIEIEPPVKEINGVPVVQANSGESLAALAQRAGIDVMLLMKYNEVAIDHKVAPGAFYFLNKKRTKTDGDFHKVRAGENLWQISQQYGIHVKRLKKYNRLEAEGDVIKEGTTIWLNTGKPREDVVFGDTESVIEVEEDVSFEWADLKQEDQIKKPDGLSKGLHQVQPKETLYSIAKANNISVDDLLAFNHLDESGGIQVGQLLKVAGDEQLSEVKVPDSTVTSREIIHEVQSKETLYSVARQYGVTIKELMEWNEKTELKVSMGEKLRILGR
jgi:membrane-bound lytic murein transglycosylase D